MNITKNKLKELSFDELNEITGGTFFFDMGVSLHHFWNRISRDGSASEVWQRW